MYKEVAMNDYIVYIHTFPNNKKYVGITCQGAELRWRCNGNGYKTQDRVFRAIKKYGWDAVVSKVLSTGLTKAEAENYEIELINLYDCTNKMFGYNSDNGGNHPGRNTAETRAKISAAKKGKKMSVDARNNMSVAQTGRKQTNETKQLLSDQRKGIPKSEGTKIKISESLKNNPIAVQIWKNILIKQRKPVVQLSLENEIIVKHKSISIASHATGVCRTNINNCCLRKVGSKTAGGYKWEYDNE